MEKINLTYLDWMNDLHSTGILSSYYTWEGKNFKIDGERPDDRVKILNTLPDYYFKNKIVIDIGCNIGRMSHYAHSKNASKVVGYEYDKNTFIAANKILEIENIKNIEFRNNNLAEDAAIEKCDIAFCFSVLHHINPRFELLKQINDKVNDFVFLESNHKEYPYNFPYKTKDDEWLFDNFDKMNQYILKYLTNFEYFKTIGTSERNRPIVLYKRKKIFFYTC